MKNVMYSCIQTEGFLLRFMFLFQQIKTKPFQGFHKSMFQVVQIWILIFKTS